MNCICPGAFPTDAERIHPDPEGYSRFVVEHQALKRRGHPSDIAEAMLCFAGDRAGFVTGRPLNVDGGCFMQQAKGIYAASTTRRGVAGALRSGSSCRC